MLVAKLLIVVIFLTALSLFFLTRTYVSATQKIMIAVLGVVMVVIASFRPGEMPDYANYYDAFIANNSIDGSRFEPSFKLIRLLAFRVPILGFLLYASLSITLRLRMILHMSPLVWGSIAIYISNLFVLHDMIQIRASVASALLLVAIPYIYSREFKKFCIVVLVATLFHYSAAVFLPLWFIKTDKSNKYFFITMLVLSYAIAVFNISLTKIFAIIPFAPTQVLYASYAAKVDDYVNVFNILQLGRCLLCLVFWWFVDFVQQKYKLFITLLKIYTISLCMLPLFADVAAIAVRLSQLLLVVEMILVPVGLYFIIKQEKLAKMLVGFYSVLLLYFTLTNPLYW